MSKLNEYAFYVSDESTISQGDHSTYLVHGSLSCSPATAGELAAFFRQRWPKKHVSIIVEKLEPRLAALTWMDGGWSHDIDPDLPARIREDLKMV